MYIKNKIQRWCTYSIIKTIYLNFRALPFRQAIRFPIMVAKRTDLIGIVKGSISIAENVTIKPKMILIGFSFTPMISTHGNYTMIRIQSGGHIQFGSDIMLQNGVSIICSEGGRIEFGSDINMNQNTKIYANKKVTIGDHVRFGWECQVLDSDCHLIYDAKTNSINNPIGEIYIGNNVWIASRSTIMKNGYIPPYSIISGNSVVNKSFKDIETQGNVFAGTPAILRTTGRYRLLNSTFESETKQHFLQTGEKTINPKNFDYTQYLSTR